MKFLKTLFRRRPPEPRRGGFISCPHRAIVGLVEALGLGGQPVGHLRIDVPAEGVVEVRAILYIDDDQARAMTKVFKEYRLVEHEPPAGGGA